MASDQPLAERIKQSQQKQRELFARLDRGESVDWSELEGTLGVKLQPMSWSELKERQGIQWLSLSQPPLGLSTQIYASAEELPWPPGAPHPPPTPSPVRSCSLADGSPEALATLGRSPLDLKAYWEFSEQASCTVQPWAWVTYLSGWRYHMTIRKERHLAKF